MGSDLGGAITVRVFPVEDDLTVQADGSGTVKLIVHSAVPEEVIDMAGSSSRGGFGNSLEYPPIVRDSSTVACGKTRVWKPVKGRSG